MATRILIVEDENTLRETLVYNLSKEGYQVTQSGDGADALDLARAESYELIVLDELCHVAMPHAGDRGRTAVPGDRRAGRTGRRDRGHEPPHLGVDDDSECATV